MHFAEVRFPENIAYGSIGGPEYSTTVIESISGLEQRNVNWSSARIKYNVAQGVKSEDQLAELIAFFRNRKGKAVGFRFKDWLDYKCEHQLLAQGDGMKTSFQFCKSYENGGEVEVRNIRKLVQNTVKLYLNNTEIVSGFVIDCNEGLVTFENPLEVNVDVYADFEFDIPVRFDTDILETSIDSYGVNSPLDIPIIEIK